MLGQDCFSARPELAPLYGVRIRRSNQLFEPQNLNSIFSRRHEGLRRVIQCPKLSPRCAEPLSAKEKKEKEKDKGKEKENRKQKTVNRKKKKKASNNT